MLVLFKCVEQVKEADVRVLRVPGLHNFSLESRDITLCSSCVADLGGKTY